MKAIAWIGSLVVAALAGCSDGGGSSAQLSGDGTVNPPAGGSTGLQGAYYGTTANNIAFDTLVLDGGRFYVLYGQRVGDALAVSGFIEGSGTSNNGSFSSTDARDFSDGTNTPATISISYGTGTGLTGSIFINGATTATDTFSALPVTSGYDYATAAKLTDISGNWTLTAVTGEQVPLTIDGTNGNLNASVNGCTISGTVTPRTSGRNVFDVSLTFGNETACTRPNETATGNAISYLLPDGRRQIVIAGTNTARDAGTALFGVR